MPQINELSWTHSSMFFLLTFFMMIISLNFYPNLKWNNMKMNYKMKMIKLSL